MFYAVNELGSGEFGVVWLAEAIGISAFRPRDILREKGSRRRFSFFNRMVKRNSYVYSREVTKVAVKKIKGFAVINISIKIIIHNFMFHCMVLMKNIRLSKQIKINKFLNTSGRNLLFFQMAILYII